MVPGTKGDDSFVLNIGKNKIGSSSEVTFLGVKIDKQLKYKSHIEELFRRGPFNCMLCVVLESIWQLKRLIVSLPKPR